MARSSCPCGSRALWLWRRFSGWQPCTSGSTWFSAENFGSDGFPGCFPDSSPNDWDDENGNCASCSSLPRWSTIPSKCLEPKDSFKACSAPQSLLAKPRLKLPRGRHPSSISCDNHVTDDVPGMTELWQQKPEPWGHVLWKKLAVRRREKVKADTNIYLSIYLSIYLYISSKSIQRSWRILDIWDSLLFHRASLMAQMIKNLPAIRETWVWSLGWDDPLEKDMATHSRIPAWEIPWKEEPGGLHSIGSQSQTQLND